MSKKEGAETAGPDGVTLAKLMVLDENSTLFTCRETHGNSASSKTGDPWIRMALVKNASGGYQTILMERGKLVCETKTSDTPWEAAMAMLDYTSAQVGEALALSRKSLRDGRSEQETVLTRQASRDSEQCTQCSGESEMTIHVPVDVNRGRPWGKHLTRLGSTDSEVSSCSKRRGSLPY